jgi:hypothetical protein
MWDVLQAQCLIPSDWDTVVAPIAEDQGASITGIVSASTKRERSLCSGQTIRSHFSHSEWSANHAARSRVSHRGRAFIQCTSTLQRIISSPLALSTQSPNTRQLHPCCCCCRGYCWLVPLSRRLLVDARHPDLLAIDPGLSSTPACSEGACSRAASLCPSPRRPHRTARLHDPLRGAHLHSHGQLSPVSIAGVSTHCATTAALCAGQLQS